LYVDSRGFNQKVTREVTSALQNTLTTSQGLQLSREHSQTWTAGGKLGGMLGEKDVKQVNAEVSVQFEDGSPRRA
jgi:phosphoribosyl-AMP cyclohydrolase